MSGNQVSQEKLYNKYKQSVYNFIRSKYSVYYDLDDDVSEIMIKVIMNLSSYDETKSKFKSWVFSIAKNHMIDKWRNNSCTTTVLSSNNISFTSTTNCELNISNSGTLTTSNTNFGTTLNNNFSTCSTAFETSNSISYLSTQISAQDFTLLDMKYVQGYNYNEIGKEFNVTSSTISNRINYIKTKLKNSITEDVYD